jgi:hypothetical protein
MRKSKQRSYRKSGGGFDGGVPHGMPTGGNLPAASPGAGPATGPAMPPTSMPTAGPATGGSPTLPGADPVVQTGGGSLGFSEYNSSGGMAKSQYYTISGGRRRRGRKTKHSRTKRGSKRNYKGGNGVIATAALPLGLFALQRYFKGSKTSKQGMQKMGRSFKRTFRRRRY